MSKLSNPGKLALVIVAAALVFGMASWILAPDGHKPGDPGNTVAVAAGSQLYAEHCAVCHGENLEGESDWKIAHEDGSLPAPPHDQSGHTWHHGDELLFNYTKKGGAAIVPEGFKSAMPGFGDALSDREIWDILAFIKSTWPTDIRIAQAAR